MTTLDLQTLQDAIRGTAAAFRCVTEYQPAGGAGDKVFPPTYEGGKYAMEKRRLPGGADPVDCVLLDSVQSQANRMELALLEAWERAKDHPEKDKRLPLPVITVDFARAKNASDLQKVLRITSLEAPHRIADALLRDSLVTKGKDGKDLPSPLPFRNSDIGAALDHVDIRNATALFKVCPTALVFGMWDSTGPKGGLGAKFQRALVSEVVGIGVQTGVKTSSRIDPAQIVLGAGPLYQARGGGWTLDETQATKSKGTPNKLGKEGKPSEANHGNVKPTIADGGVTLERALQTTVLSLPALRRLRFPLSTGKPSDPKVDDAARTALAALAICAATLTREQGCDLRSRCLLVPTSGYDWELLGPPTEQPKRFTLTPDGASALLHDAVKVAKDAGLPWMDQELTLTPSPELVALVKKSQDLAAAAGGAEEGGD
jgi:CRISPR-associated protein Csb1